MTATAEGAPGKQQPGRLSILLVGDSPDDTGRVEAILQGFDIDGSLDMCPVHTVKEAFESLVRRRPQLIIVTVNGQRSTGLEVLRSIRSFQRRRIACLPVAAVISTEERTVIDKVIVLAPYHYSEIIGAVLKTWNRMERNGYPVAAVL